MAVYSKGNETKKRFVMLTYHKLCEKKASEITVRDLARENGCSAAALYRHFESLEYLIAVASVRFLDEYMRQYASLLDSDRDLLEIYIEGWELFNHYAFARPDIYYRLFWGTDNGVFGAAFQDYFELFPFKGSEKYTAYTIRCCLMKICRSGILLYFAAWRMPEGSAARTRCSAATPIP